MRSQPCSACPSICPDAQDELLPPGSSCSRIQRADAGGARGLGRGAHEGEGCIDDEGVRMLAREADLKLAPLSNEDLLKEPDKIVDMDEVGTFPGYTPHCK